MDRQKQSQSPQEITKEQIDDVYFEGTSDGINIQSSTEVITNSPKKEK